MPKRHAGYALIEALVTLVVILVGLTGALRLQAELLLASADAKATDEATVLAIAKLNDFLAISSPDAYRSRIVPGTILAQGLLHRYRLDWTVNHNVSPDHKQVLMQVSWPSDDPLRRLHFQTIIPSLDLPRFARQQLQP